MGRRFMAGAATIDTSAVGRGGKRAAALKFRESRRRGAQGAAGSALAFIPEILDRPVQPFRVHRLLRPFLGLDRLGVFSGTASFRVLLRSRFVSLIQVYAPPPQGGDSRGVPEIKLVPPKVD
jgi:hypothetical protein